jgi:hypothetical protein
MLHPIHRKVQLFKINYDEREYNAVPETLKFGWITMGQRTVDFEHAHYIRQSLKGADIVHTFKKICSERGAPESVCLDNGPEVVSKELDLSAYCSGVKLGFSCPGITTSLNRIALLGIKRLRNSHPWRVLPRVFRLIF